MRSIESRRKPVRNVIIEEEKARGGERAEKGWCRKGRNRYGAGAGYIGVG